MTQRAYQTFLLLSWLLLGLLVTGCQTRPSRPQALYELKQEIKAWVDSGAYDAEVTAIMADAQAKLLAALPTSPKPAIVLDVDDTAISTLEYQRKSDFGYSTCDLKTWQEAANGPALPAVHAMYLAALERGVAVFFITGRRENLRTATEANLKFAGYDRYHTLFHKPNDWKAGGNVAFKSGIRQQLRDQGYDLILNIGDQDSDLEGGLARHPIKLPNPFYLSK